jgi:hypothetical protein
MHVRNVRLPLDLRLGKALKNPILPMTSDVSTGTTRRSAQIACEALRTGCALA